MTVEILACGAVTSVGLSARATAAAVRARLARFHASGVLDRKLRGITMALVPASDLPPLAEGLAEVTGVSSRALRMLRLAGLALAETLASEPHTARIPVLAAVPAPHPGLAPPTSEAFLDHLAVQADLPFARAESRLFPHGRAGGAFALAEAIARLHAGKATSIVAGGVDTHLDLRLLARLDAEARLRMPGTLDGFLPGEAAAFLWLARPGTGAKLGRPPLAHLRAAATASETGHLYSEAPYRGDGLADAFRAAFGRAPMAPMVRTVLSGLNGEGFSGKEWGVAVLRNRPRFAEGFATICPADRLGDTGAAMIAVHSVLAALGIQEGYRAPPCLVWAASDLEERGAVLLDAP